MAVKKKPVSRRREVEEEERPASRGRERERDGGEDERNTERGGSKGKRRSLADSFDKAKASGSVADGKYAALIIEMKLNETDKGTSVQCRYEIADEGDYQGQEIVQFYSLADADGEEQKGCGFLKRDLAILDKGDVRFSELESVLAEIQEEMPGVNITVKNNPPYTNAYLNGINEDDVIDDWKKDRPDKPY